MNFSINCLEITASKEIVEQNGNIYKNLLIAKEFSESGFKFPKRFFFNDYYKREPDEQGNLFQQAKAVAQTLAGPCQESARDTGPGKCHLVDGLRY